MNSPFRFAILKILGAVLLATFALSSTGCSGCVPSEFPTYPVSGVVTFEGKPLPGGGSIRFVPLAEVGQTEAGGAIAADGSYRLTTFTEFDGATAGEFRVEVYQNAVLQQAVYPDQSPAIAQGAEPAYVEPTIPEVRVAPADLLPEIYAQSASPLRATVEKRVNENLNFNLLRQVP